MKKYIPVLHIIFLFFGVITVSAQQKDIGQSFQKNGFIQNIDYAAKIMILNFIEKTAIVSEVIYLPNTQYTNENKEVLKISDLKYNDEIILLGERYNVDKYSEATKIIRIKPTVNSTTEGMVDFIKNDFAYVDGNKIKLNTGKKIKGKKKSGYENKSFSKFGDLKLYDFANLKGKYNAEGYILADEFILQPNNETDFDKMADTIDKEAQQKFYPLWIDKNKRSRLFNSEVGGIGKIHNDAIVQEYIQNIGMKLVPEAMKEKVKFIFIVVENPDFNANVRANGLCYVYTGLLKALENEAQLAAVLSHEISHVIYKHISKEMKQREKLEKNKLLVSDGSKISINAYNKLSDKSKNNPENEARKAALKQNIHDIEIAAQNLLERRLATFSVEEEEQADRVGLSILVLAGYDPRQAPIIWKNIYNRYGVLRKVEAGVKLVKRLREELTADNSAKKNARADKGKSKFKVGMDLLNLLVRWKASDAKSKSFQTHPEHSTRFEALNRLIALYWNNEELLNKSMIGEENYLSIVKRLNKRNNN